MLFATLHDLWKELYLVTAKGVTKMRRKVEGECEHTHTEKKKKERAHTQMYATIQKTKRRENVRTLQVPHAHTNTHIQIPHTEAW